MDLRFSTTASVRNLRPAQAKSVRRMKLANAVERGQASPKVWPHLF